MPHKKNSELFSVSPKKIVFYAPYNYTQKRLMTILNPTGQRLLFKIRTNAPAFYTAFPNCGCIKPYDIIECFIKLRCLNSQPVEELSHRICVQCIQVPENDDIQADTITFKFKQTHRDMLQNVRVCIELRPEPLEIPQELLDFLLAHDFKRLSCRHMHYKQLRRISTRNSSCQRKYIITAIFIMLTGLFTGELQLQHLA